MPPSESEAQRKARMSNNRVDTVVLTELEAKICDILVAAADHLHEKDPLKDRVTLRIAGGWVRDKVCTST
jgi:hypothetical protein